MFRSALICLALGLSAAAQAQSYPTPTFQSVITASDAQYYGAKCDGVTDDSAALNAAATAVKAAGKALRIPNAVCYSASALNFGSLALVGAAPLIPTNPPSGPTIKCAATIVAPCVTVGTALGTTDLGAVVRDVAFAFAGTPVAGDAALQVQGHNSNLTNTLAYNAWDGYLFASGISAHAGFLYTWNIYHDHLVQNGFPEIYIVNARFGMNGAGDQTNSNSFFGFTGSDPNTMLCSSCQLNLGSVSPKYIYDFFNLTSQVNGVYQLSDSIIDMSLGNSIAVIHSDGTGTCFRCIWNSVTLNAPGMTFFSLGSATSMNEAVFANSNFFIHDFTLPSIQVAQLRLANLFVSGSVTLNGSNSQAVVSNILSSSPFVVQGSWSSLQITNVLGSTYTDAAATGPIFASGVPATVFTPQLQFGGANAGMTQSVIYGKATRMADGTVKQIFGVELTALGSSTGSATIIGTPYVCNGFGLGQIDMGPIYSIGLASLTGTSLAAARSGSSGVSLFQSSGTGMVALTQANFTNTSSIAGTVVCQPN